MSKMKKRRLVTIVTLLVLMIGSINLIELANKIVKVSVDLILIRDDIEFYNENSRKTDNMTECTEKLMQERNEKYYQSEDWQIKTFSNMFWGLKIIILMAMLSMYIMIPYMWIRVIAFFIRRYRRRLSKKGTK